MFDVPEHFPIAVNSSGQGPADDAAAVACVCWCGDLACMKFYARGDVWVISPST